LQFLNSHSGKKQIRNKKACKFSFDALGNDQIAVSASPSETAGFYAQV